MTQTSKEEASELLRQRYARAEKLMREGERIDELQRNEYLIFQNPGRFCFGMDAVLLSAFVHVKPGARVLDLGTGTGILPLLVEAKTPAGELYALEIQAESADMARRSVEVNGLSDKIKIIDGDLKEAGRIFGAASFDAVTCNPPYMTAEHGLTNPELPKAIARHEVLCTLEDVVREAATVLRPGGNFFMVHRPFRLAEIIRCLSEHGLELKRMQMVHPYVDKEPNMVLLEANKGGRPRVTVEAPIIVFREPGVYHEDITGIYGY